jgi:hypothetical protein
MTVRSSLAVSVCLALVAVVPVVSTGCANDDEPVPAAAEQGAEDDLTGKTTYVDLVSTFKQDSDYEAWSTLRRGLVQGFDDICGDTFCGGDFGDLRAVNLTCSATEKTGKVRECLWTFGGSYGAVTGKTGAIQSVGQTFACKIPVAASGAAFLALSKEASPLRATLPGKTTTIYDALVGCFENKKQLPLPTEGTFVDLVDTLSEEQWTKLAAVKTNLRKGFDDVCGDTFCEGDYSDIEPLSFRCSVDPATSKLGQCAWTFAGAYGNVARTTGNVTSKTKSWTCQLPITGTVDGMLTALAGADPLNAPLPGSDKSIYDSLVDCL